MKFLYNLFSIFFLLFLSSACFYIQAQGSEILILQYNKGPALDNEYSRWSISSEINLNRINTDIQNTSPKLTLGMGVQIELRASKTFGFISGINLSPVKYSYQRNDSLGQDRLTYYSFPIGILLQPTKKISLELGALYNIFRNGTYSRSLGTYENIKTYPKNIFRNSFGGFFQINYKFYKKVKIFTNFRWVRRSSPPIQMQTNNLSGFQLGLNYRLWSSKSKKWKLK
ncbi:MAG: hypothetical protein CBD39_03850 [Flavobacteriaceae bacterium TMED179]|nr:MAG: hypothetical protein CBD39_03850 [Flavobacteriaceae bacterium TMED179]|tara:strand:+ start:5914 stop:6594 length:681 start_codon:yes stop_codon:yes gene_type:complete